VLIYKCVEKKVEVKVEVEEKGGRWEDSRSVIQ
jgi:hypothetical protein